ncbi:MAG: hypothetical protein ACRDZM_17105 [Acidimicrobiia bacterium]
MRSIGKHWLVIAGVLSALMASEAALRVFQAEIPESSTWPTVETEVKSRQINEMSTDVDVLFLGSSVTEAAVDPALLIDRAESYSVYNAALPFSTPLSDEVWLDEVILPRMTPSVVIYGIAAWPPHSTIGNDLLRAGIEAVARKDESRLAESIALIDNKGLLADWDERRTRQNLIVTGPWTDEGHMRGYYDMARTSIAGAYSSFGTATMSSDNLSALRTKVGELTDSGIKVALMIEPGRFPGEVRDSDLEAYVASVMAIGEKLGVPVWDTYHVEWDEGYFVDEAHFNRRGTVAFTHYIGPFIEELVSG